MTSTADTQVSQFIEGFKEAQTELIEGAAEGAAEVARESTNTYVKGLNVIAEQQTLSYQAFQQRVSQLMEGAAEVARGSTNTYVKGLKVIAEQQGPFYQAFQQWVSGMASAQSHIRQQFLESYDSARGELVTSAEHAAKLASEAGAEAAEASSRAAGSALAGRRPAVAEAPRRPAPTRSQSASTQPERPGPANWASEGYESLTAAEIITKLPQLSQHELGEVETYEKAHQSRQTVLQKVASLRGQEPVPGYDELNVQEIQKWLADGDVELATRVRDYERPRKSRDGVLHAVEAQLSKS